MTKTIPTESRTMAWMSVADAATVLGVPERTIWKRIKAKTIESQKDNGQTVVRIEEREPDSDSMRQLSTIDDSQSSRFTSSQLSIRKLDAGAVSEVLAVLTEYRASCDEEIAHSRRTTRLIGGVTVGLLIAIGACVWYYTATLGELRYEHAIAVSGLNSVHQEVLGQSREHAAHADGLSIARAAEIENLQQIESKQQERLTAIETSRDRLQNTIDERLTGFQTLTAAQQVLHKSLQKTMSEHLAESNATIAAQQTAVETGEGKLVQLQRTVEELRADLHQKELELSNKELVYQAVQKQTGKINEAIRRSAARSIGMAEGLRLNVSHQEETIRRLRQELAEAEEAQIALDAPALDAPALDAPALDAPALVHDEGEVEVEVEVGIEIENVQMRQLLWDSIINSTADHANVSSDAGIKQDGIGPLVEETQPSASSDASPWKAMLESCFRLWLFGPSDSTCKPKRDEFAQAK